MRKDGIGKTYMKICCQHLSYDSGCQPVHCACVLLYCAVKLYFLLIFSAYDIMCLHCTSSLLYYSLYLCTVNTGSVMNHLCTGCPKKNARSWHFGYNSTLEMARNKGRVCFEKFRKFSIWRTQKFFNLTY